MMVPFISAALSSPADSRHTEDRSGALKIEYDTLTTELAYLMTDGTWKHCINHVYQKV